ncbi:hypothetical protein [Microvirga arabica]|uniref:hypothetical protein n=1 Tax=Microvirga arabica TaxID=1128671 RepID=UPI001939CB35|nr:hypothetical protein [Microvirga arabica]MBM1169627.1 hypothetical protein [Microvirga arabica]
MRYSDINHTSALQRTLTAIRQAGQTLGIKSGFIDDARRAATPYVVECTSLNDEDLPYSVYITQLRERESWCVQRCPHDHEIEPLREHGRLIGRQFRFSRESDAAAFRLFFG